MIAHLNHNHHPLVDPAVPRSPSEIAESLTGRGHLSYSELSCYQACPLKWHFSYVQRAQPESVSAAMVLGTGVHAGIQKHLEHVLAAESPPPLTELMEAYRSAWTKETTGLPVKFAKDDTAASLEATAQSMLQAYLESPLAWPEGQILGIEENLKVPLADDLPPLAGRVDLMVHHGDTLIITDFKTARSMWSEKGADDHADQLLLYGLAAAPMLEALQAKLQLQFIVITKAKVPKVEVFAVEPDPGKVQRTVQVARQVFRAMQGGAIYPAPSPMNCVTCPYQQRCQRWHEEVTP